MILVSRDQSLKLGESAVPGKTSLLMKVHPDDKTSKGSMIVATKILLKGGKNINIPGLVNVGGVYVYFPMISVIKLFELLKRTEERQTAIGAAA